MFKIVLISLALTGLQALPISRSLTKTHHDLPLGVQDGLPLSDGFKQGTEASRRFIVDLNTGLVQDYISEMDTRTGLLSPVLDKGHGEITDNTVEEVPVQKNGGGWVRVEGQSTLPDGFRQGTEPSNRIPDGFRQGTERLMPIPDGFRQGTEPSIRIPNGFRQGTERFMPVPDGFRQGTEPSLTIPTGFRQGTEPTLLNAQREAAPFLNTIRDGFRQGTEPSFRIPDGFRQGTERFMPIPEGFHQGTEPSFRIPVEFRQGTEPSIRIPDGFRQGTERFMPIPDGFRQGTEPSLRIPTGFRQGTEPTNPDAYREVALSLNSKPVDTISDGFRQGTEPSIRIPDGFRQGTEPFMPIPDGFHQGTEPSLRIPNGFRQGTEPSIRIPDGFRQGTERLMPILDGFRQGTEPSLTIPSGFRQGTEPTNPLGHKDTALPDEPSNLIQDFRPGTGPFMPVRDGQSSNQIQVSFSNAIEPSEFRQEPKIARCDGEILNGRCYIFNPTPMPFLEAQDSCKSLNPNAELASVTDEDLHSRLVSMVTKGGQRDPVMTWLGGMVKNQQGSWLDGSEWRYNDWMPGQPNIHTDKPVCMEMFRMDETWWTAADCDLKRASICSYPVVA